MINISADTRTMNKGDIYVALRGYSSDGHDYIEKAIENGASKLIVEDEGEYSIPYEIVPDTRKYMTDYLIKNYQKYLNEMTIVGITGTNGKTTTAYLLYDALNKLDKDCAYIGTIGYYLKEGRVKAIPNTSPDICDTYNLLIDAYDKGYRYVVLEASSQGLVRNWLGGILFDYAIFTNLTPEHLDWHKTMDEYAKAKTVLFNQLNDDGIGIVNFDDPYKTYFKAKNLLYYGIDGGDYKAENIEYSNQSTKFECIFSSNYEIESPLLGRYNIYNLLATLTVLSCMGYEKNQIESIVKNLTCPPGRMDIITYNSNSIIVDYAHTPDAIENILSAIKGIVKGNIYTVFGCTGNRDRTKRPVMTNIVTSNSKYAIITNDDPHDEESEDIVKDMIEGISNTNYEVIIDRGKAIEKGISLLEENDVLLILGKGHEEFMIMKNYQKTPFNDRKKVEEIINI